MLVTRYLCFLGVDLKSISQFFSERYVWRGLPQQVLFIFFIAMLKPRACWVNVIPLKPYPQPPQAHRRVNVQQGEDIFYCNLI